MESRKPEYLRNCEIYRLTLEHYINDIAIEEPLVVQTIMDRTYAPSPICLNAMFNKMKDEMLKRVRSDK